MDLVGSFLIYWWGVVLLVREVTRGCWGIRILTDRALPKLPELEMTPEEETLAEESKLAVEHESSSRVLVELEPAFLNEKDYPQDWLVYHAKLGVVLKTEADEYDKKRMADAHVSMRPATAVMAT